MIPVNEKLGIDLLPSQGKKIVDLTVFNNGTYWIQGPVLREVENALGEPLSIPSSAKALYRQICRVEVACRPQLYRFRFNKYPMRPWFMRDIYEYHRWLAMVEMDEHSNLAYVTRHRYMAIAAVKWLAERGYAVEVDLPEVLEPPVGEQVTVEVGQMNCELREHQKESVEAARRRDYRIVIGDQAGLGKTITTGAILKELSRSGVIGRILWVVPNTSLTEQVRGEMLDKFNTEVFLLTGETCSRRERLGLGEGGKQVCATIYEKHGFVCTNWSLFSKDFTKDLALTGHISFDAVVLDEAHRCKEGNAAYDAALSLSSPVRIALSGTVMPNGQYEELFDMLNVIDPPAAPSKEYFKSLYGRYFAKLKETTTERKAKAEARRKVNRVALKYMTPRISCHGKQDVIGGLPNISESRIHIPFTEVDRAVFDSFKDILFGIIDEVKGYPEPWSLYGAQKARFYSLKAAMMMVYQDLRRFCAFGASVLPKRIDEYMSNEKGAYRVLRGSFFSTIKYLSELSEKARESPKNRKIVDFLKEKTLVKKAVIFCSEIEPNKRMVFDLVRKKIPTKVIMGKQNTLSDEEAAILGQGKRFRDRDIEDVLSWFWMPFSCISRFAIGERDRGNLRGLFVGERQVFNLFYTSLAIALPKERDFPFVIRLEDASETDRFLKEINDDGFYRCEVREGELVFSFVQERKKVLVTTDKLQEGINLQDANCVIFYDYPFSIREREQRMSRVWRDGSRHENIAVIYAMNGIEYKIEEKLKEKYKSTSVLGLSDPSSISMRDLLAFL